MYFYLLYKNLPSDKLFKVFIIRLLLDFVAGIKFLTEGGYKDLFAVVKAHFSFYFSIRKNYFKRKNISHRKVSEMYDGNIVWDHYIRKKKIFSELNPDLFKK